MRFPDAYRPAGEGAALPFQQPVPTVLSLTSVTSTAAYGGWAYLVTTGQTVTFDLTTNEAVSVAAGTTLTLSNGATAVYEGDGSAETSNTFVYTVGSGDASARDLQVTGYTGSISDQAGQTLNPVGVTEDTTVEVYFGTTSFSVFNQDQMSTVFHSIDIEGPLEQANTGYSVSLTSDFALSSQPDAINVEGSDTLLFDGGGHTISGGPYELFLIESGAVTFEDLNITGAQSIVMRGGQSVTLEASAGQSMTVSGPIANEYGSNAGLIIQGAGAVTLSGANTFAGGISLQSGVLDFANASAAGSGEIVFTGNSATLTIEAGDAPANLIGGLAVGDVIDLKGIGLAAGSALAAAATLRVTGSSSTETLDLDPDQDFSSFDFAISSDGHGGTLLTAQAIPGLTDTTSTGSPFATAGETVTFTLATDQAVTVAAGTKLTLSNGATAVYSGSGSASTTNTFVYTVGSGDAVTADLQVNGYSGSITQGAQVIDPSTLARDTGVDVYKTGTSFTVSTEDQLNSVIEAINSGGPLSQAGAAYTITLAGDMALATALDPIDLVSGTLTIDGAGHTIGGPATAFVVNSGGVTYQDLNISSPQAIDDSGNNFSWISASAGKTVTISGSISGIYGVRPNGQGTVVLSGANTFVGPMGLLSGVLDIANPAAAGMNDIDFDVAGAELAIEAGDAPTNPLNQLAAGDKIDLKGIGLASGSALAAAATLTVHGSTSTETINLDTRQDFSSFDFAISSDGNGGTLLTVRAIAPVLVANSLTSATSDAPYGAGYFVTAGQSVIFTLTTNEAVTVSAGTVLTLSNGATAVYAGNGSASASNTFTYLIGSADDVARDLQVTGYTGSITAQDGKTLGPAGVTEDTGVTVYAGTTSFSVSDRDQLATVFHTIDLEGALSQPDTVYRIALTGGAPITGAAIDSINLDDSERLVIDGGGQTTNLASQGLTIAGGDVIFEDLNMAGAHAITIAGGERATLEATSGQTMTIGGSIVDLYGPGPGIAIVGPGTVVLSAASTFAGGVTLQSGVLDLANVSAAGTGEILFGGASATLAIEAGEAPANLIGGLAVGDVIDLKGIGLAAGSILAASATLTVQGSSSTETLNLDPGQDFNDFEFAVSGDGHGGTLLTAESIPAATVAQYESKLAHPSSVFGRYVVVDTAAHIQSALSTLESTAGYLAAVKAVGAGISLNLAQALALEKANLKISVQVGQAFVVQGSALDIEALTAAQISGLSAVGVSSLISTNANVSFTSAQTAAILASGLNVSALGGYTVTENTATGYSVFQGGQLTQQKYIRPDGSYEISNWMSGKPYSLYENIYSASQARLIEAFENADGSGSLLLTAAGLKISLSSTHNYLTSAPDTFGIPHPIEAINANWYAGETFSLSAGFGHAAISNFSHSGAGHGVIDLSVSMFSYLTPAMTQAQDLAAVLSHATTTGGNLVITDTAGDTLTLDGLSAVLLTANPADVHFAGEVPVPATIAQYEAHPALYKSISGGFSVADTAAHLLAGLSVLEAVGSHITSIRSTDAGLILSVAQALGLEVPGLKITVPSGDAVRVKDWPSNIEALTPAQLSGLVALGVSSLVARYSVSFTPAQTAAILSSGLTVSALGGYTVTENTATGYSVFQGGRLIQQKYIRPDGSYEISNWVSGKPYSLYENIYSASQARLLEVFENADGSGSLLLTAPGLKISLSSTHNYLTSAPDTFGIPHPIESINANWYVGETFSLSAGFGQAAISNFTHSGTSHDVIDLSVSMFSYLTPAMTQAQDLAAVLSHATTRGGNLVITDTAGDTLTLDGLSAALLTANAADVSFAVASRAQASRAATISGSAMILGDIAATNETKAPPHGTPGDVFAGDRLGANSVDSRPPLPSAPQFVAAMAAFAAPAGERVGPIRWPEPLSSGSLPIAVRA